MLIKDLDPALLSEAPFMSNPADLTNPVGTYQTYTRNTNPVNNPDYLGQLKDLQMLLSGESKPWAQEQLKWRIGRLQKQGRADYQPDGKTPVKVFDPVSWERAYPTKVHQMMQTCGDKCVSPDYLKTNGQYCPDCKEESLNESVELDRIKALTKILKG
jgi:hypothetical protein